jgi:hypothetical protein
MVALPRKKTTRLFERTFPPQELADPEAVMIPVWIIDELVRREEKQRRQDERRRERLELPISSPPYPLEDEEEKPKTHGPIVIEF